jgi:hypothetical protein
MGFTCDAPHGRRSQCVCTTVSDATFLFLKLCRFIEPFVSIDEKMSKLRTGGKSPITVEIILHCLLRWLGGGSYLDIRISAGISVASFYRCIHASMKAILLCDALLIHFPTTDKELQTAVDNFKAF